MTHGFFHENAGTPIRRIGLAVACAIALASCDKLGLGGDSPTAPSGPPGSTTIVYTAVGASDASGVGSSLVCIGDVSCPDGMGYVQVAVRTLKSQGRQVTLRNLGIPTAVISQRFQTLGLQYGRAILGNFLDQEVPSVRSDTTLVTIFAGVNEVNTITGALGGGAGGADPAGYLDAQVRNFNADYASLVSGIRTRAPQARIIALNLPNVAGLPSLAGASFLQRQAAQRAAVAMSANVNTLAAQGIAVVDLMCDSRSYLPSNYSSDGLHPNDSGYAFIAGLLVNAITSTSYPNPQGSCSGMTIVQ
jgi:lysophospholipase L1-like esterase